MRHVAPGFTPRRLNSMLAVVAVAIVLTACSAKTVDADQPGATPDGSAPAATQGAPLSGDVTVFAAASLTDTFNQLADAFEKSNPDVTIKPVYDGSSTLATQLTEGAAADVFASADEANMKKATDAGVMDGAADVFTKNILQIAVQPGNPHHITSLQDLADTKLLVVLCAPEVPCGTASATLLADAGVKVTPVSEEQNVKAVLTKVSLGEADAGLVYATDVKASGANVDGIDIANADKAINTYMIGVPSSSANKAAGKAFIDVVLSNAGQKILGDAGFQPR